MGFNLMVPNARTITVALCMSKPLNRLNTHTNQKAVTYQHYRHNHEIHRKHHQRTQILQNIQKHTSIPIHHKFKTGVPQGDVLSSTLLSIYAAYLSLPRAPFQVMVYADGFTITSTHTNTSAAKKYIQPYLHNVFAWTKQNNLTFNPDITTCTLLTPDPAEYKSNLDLKLNNTALLYTWQRTQKFWVLPETQTSHTAHIFTTSQYTHTSLYK